ncbi:MAG: hypothetical protein WC791_01920 [Candidatus Paceibacterota bacterium]|jgi:hypothetical protein
MTQRVPDNVVAKFARQQHDWMERVLKGSLNPVEVAQAVQGIINRSKVFNSWDYFKTRKGLWGSDSFTNHILVNLPAVMPNRGLMGVACQKLPRDMTDQQIIETLLGGEGKVRKYAFTLDQIATMIDLQPDGEDGDLVNRENRTNIFYVLVEGFLLHVNVSWNGDAWFVNAWNCLGGNGKWSAGNHIFYNKILTQ